MRSGVGTVILHGDKDSKVKLNRKRGRGIRKKTEIR